MSWHIHDNMSFADSDGYGADTDNPVSAYEVIDRALSCQDEQEICKAFSEWLEETARNYFNDVGRWGEDLRDAWREKIHEII